MFTRIRGIAMPHNAQPLKPIIDDRGELIGYVREPKPGEDFIAYDATFEFIGTGHNAKTAEALVRHDFHNRPARRKLTLGR